MTKLLDMLQDSFNKHIGWYLLAMVIIGGLIDGNGI